MLNKSRYMALIVMIILIIVGCSQEEKGEIETLASDKQAISEPTSIEEREVNDSQANEDVPGLKKEEVFSTKEQIQQESTHSSNTQQKIVYTQLNSWNNNRDYYEIAFNESLKKSIETSTLGNYIKLSPKIKGQFEKKEDKLIRFYPENRFAGDTDYKVVIDQANLFSGDYAKVELSFHNASPILKMGQVSLQETANPNEYYLEFIINHYRGRYPDKDYLNGINIRLDSKLIKVDNIAYEASGKMTLTSYPFVASEDQIFTISSKPNIFKKESKRDLYYSNSIRQMRKFLLQQVNTVTDKQGNARIELTFSKNLDTKQSLSGLVLIDGQEVKDSSISKFMNKAVITGNFKLGVEYDVEVKAGVKATDSSVIKETRREKIKTYHRDRILEFVDKGLFLSSKSNNSLNIKVVNYSEFDYQLWAVQVENIAEMIHNINILNYSNNIQNNYYRNENLHWYGQLLKSGSKTTDVEIDTDSFIKLDLGHVANEDPDKIYILNLTGKNKKKDRLSYLDAIRSPRSYYSNNNEASKLMLFTDYAITAKGFKGKVAVNVVDVLDGSPISRADVELRAQNNILLASGKTNWSGELILDDLSQSLDNNQFFIVAEKKGSIGFLSSESMYLDNTRFKVEHDYTQNEYKIEAFVDRDLYRPGETVNLMVIARDSNNNLVREEFPIIVTVYNQKSAKIKSEKISDYSEGFAHYTFETSSKTNTGFWRFEVEYGSLKKFVNFNIETFVPERINTSLKANKDFYSSDDENLELSLSSKYLFGQPLVGAKCNIDLSFNHNYSFAQEKFSKYSFIDDFFNNDYSMFRQSQELTSDEEGQVQTNFKLLSKKESKHPYLVSVQAKVTEEGGRPIERNMVLPASPQANYIGLSNNRYLKDESGTFQIPLVVVDGKGENIVQGSRIKYIVYGKKGSWWWDYDYNYQASYKSSESTSVIAEGEITIGKDNYITFTPQTSDFHLFIVEAKIAGNNDYEINRKYFNSYWGDNSELTEDSSLEIKTDKAEYEIGQDVKISIPASKGSKLFLNIVKQNEILKQEIIDLDRNGDYIYEFEAEENMSPNVYVDVRVVQGQNDKQNDLPLRLYGIIPVKIIDKDTRLDIKLDLPEKINSNSKLLGQVDVGVKKQTQYIVSIVDQGLVNRRNYTIPNPWNLFYRNEGYFARDFDNFSFFVNAQNQEIFRTIMIGGGVHYVDAMNIESERVGSARKEMNRLQETGVQRFKPVSYFLGILETDNNGKGKFEIEIGDYIGALKVTVIAVNEDALGGTVKNVIVKDDIIAMPTLPRILSPGDEIEIPLALVIDAKVKSDVEIELVTNEIVDITSQTNYVIPQGQQNALIVFSAKVKDEIGKADFSFNLKSQEFNGSKTIEVGVRLPSAYQTDSKMLSFADDQINLTVPDSGYPSSNQVYLSFKQGFEFDADQLLKQSLRYPYGGAIMKTALTFNQLLLSDFIQDTNLRNQLDANINSYFQDIVKYNRKGLYEWQGLWKDSASRKLLNIYALHTCLLAKEKGYNVNDFVYSEILDYLSKSSNNSGKVNFEDAYQLYVLALAGKANIAKLNYYNEQEMINIESNAVAMLNMAYIESGFNITDVTKEMKADVTIQVPNWYYTGLNPSEDASTAMDLYLNSVYNNSDGQQKAKNRASALALAKEMTSTNYWNYYNKGWNLFALSGFINTLPDDYMNYQDAILEITLDDQTKKISVKDHYTYDLTPYKNKEVTIKAVSSNAKDVSVTLYDTYVKKIGQSKQYSNDINLFITYTDSDGNDIDISSLEQGESFIANIKVIPKISNNDFAATYILPSGWEFASEKLQVNNYISHVKSLSPDYVDVRDDRAIIYGRATSKYPVEHKLRINTVTKGRFMMPASTVEDLYSPEIQAITETKMIEVK